MPEQLQQILTPEGVLVAEAPVDLDGAVQLYRWMVEARAYDHKASRCSARAGSPPMPSSRARRPPRWAVPPPSAPTTGWSGTYRDAAARCGCRAIPGTLLSLGRMGDERGGSPPPGVNVLPPSITVGAHMIHAVGLGWAERLRGSDRVAITYFGDGATSEGDFHEAMNFAGVYRTPTVFVCQNNGWAISMNRERADGVGDHRAEGGRPTACPASWSTATTPRGVSVDPRGGRTAPGGARAPPSSRRSPTAWAPHTTADDAGRYRDEESLEDWRRARSAGPRAPLISRAPGRWSQEWEDEVELRRLLPTSRLPWRRAEALAPFGPGAAFDRDVRPCPPPTSRRSEPRCRKMAGARMSEMNLAHALNDALAVALDGDDRVVLLGEDVGLTGGVFRVTDGLLERLRRRAGDRHPGGGVGDRRGRRSGWRSPGCAPWPRSSSSASPIPPTTRSVSHVGRIRNRSNHRFTAPMVIRIPFGGGIGAAEHHSESSEAIYAHTPGHQGGGPGDARRRQGPAARRDRGSRPGHLPRADPGVPGDQGGGARGPLHHPDRGRRVVQAGTDVTLVAYGAMLTATQAAPPTPSRPTGSPPR